MESEWEQVSSSHQVTQSARAVEYTNSFSGEG